MAKTELAEVELVIGVGAADKSAQSAAADRLAEKLAAIASVEEAHARVNDSRALAGAASQALSLVGALASISGIITVFVKLKGVAETVNALLDMFKSLGFGDDEDEKAKDEAGEVLANLKPEEIFIRVGRRLVPLTELTEEDLSELSE
ncbi:MAG: hypothetical protein MRY74_16330 [Neomegalonema sp.]|nr:hypothetical protein [Neomegalonema sp.]